MNRKIAAIFAADVAGYSTLVAEDEEDALRRLKGYRAVIDDFIAQFGGTIFNTAGDSVMAAFPSAVDAVRCSIDVQESLRTRNRAYPETRHMLFRIGINIGDVVERDGDLLGDGVNLAARLQGLAEPGGVCISRSVHEQVVGKLSVSFNDLGERSVKNIPTPVHVYGVAWQNEVASRSRSRRSVSPWIATGVALVLVAAVFGYLMLRGRPIVATTTPVTPLSATRESLPQTSPALPRMAEPSTAPAIPSQNSTTLPAVAPISAVVSTPTKRRLVPAAIPFLMPSEQRDVAELYLPSVGHKAIALNRARFGYIIGAADEESAKRLALQRCEVRAKAAGYTTPCEIYAVGDDVVWPHAPPPIPVRPWLKRDPVIETPVTIELLRRMRPGLPERTATEHIAFGGGAYIALHPKRRGGASDFYKAATVPEDDAMRVALELCGHKVKEACIIVGVGNTLVVPVPATMSIVGLFQSATHPLVAVDYRQSLTARLAGAPNGWSAVALGGSGRPAVALGRATEQQATAMALEDCGRHERDCKIIAIGPFTVEPDQAPAAGKSDVADPIQGAKEVSTPAAPPKTTP